MLWLFCSRGGTQLGIINWYSFLVVLVFGWFVVALSPLWPSFTAWCGFIG